MKYVSSDTLEVAHWDVMIYTFVKCLAMRKPTLCIIIKKKKKSLPFSCFDSTIHLLKDVRC